MVFRQWDIVCVVFFYQVAVSIDHANYTVKTEKHYYKQ